MFYLPPFLFIFIFLLLHNFIIFLPQVFYSLLRNFIMFFPLPPPRLFYIFFHPQKKSTSYRPYIDPTLNFFFVTQLREKWKKKPPHFYCFSITTTFLLFSLHHHHISTVSLQHHHHHHHHSSIVSLLHHHQISIVFTPPVVLSFEFGLFGLRLACLACGWPLTL